MPGRLLIDASDQGFESQSVEALRLDSVLRSETGGSMTGLEQLGFRLLNGQADTETRERLRSVAQRLEMRREELGRLLRRW